MAQSALQDGTSIPTLSTSYVPAKQTSEITAHDGSRWTAADAHQTTHVYRLELREQDVESNWIPLGSTGKGILIGMLSAFGSAALVALIIALVYFFRYTNRGRIFLDRIGRPGEYDDEQQFQREEEEAMADMDDSQRAEYLRAKG